MLIPISSGCSDSDDYAMVFNLRASVDDEHWKKSALGLSLSLLCT